MNIPCYYDSGPDTASVSIGYTTGLSNYIKIYTPNNTATEVNQSQRHSGKWDNSKYRLEVLDTSALNMNSGFIKVDGLQVKAFSDGVYTVFGIYTNSPGSGGSWISNNIIWGNFIVSGGNACGIGIHDSSNKAVNYNSYVKPLTVF